MTDGPAVERITALELLHRVCRHNGWALCLVGSHDHGPVPPLTAAERSEQSELIALAVVTLFEQTQAGCPRRPRATRVELGDIVCRCTLGTGTTVQTAAELIVEGLTRNGLDLGDAA